MFLKRYQYIVTLGLISLLLLVAAGLLTACDSADPEADVSPGLRTVLLVDAPQAPLPAGRSVTVKSRTEDSQYKVSHVELYLVELLPEGSETPLLENVLIRADEAPFDQTTFTAFQDFTPVRPGHYVIKVVGYNKRGQIAESDYIGFDAK